MDKHNKHIEWKETGSRLLLFALSFLFLLLLHSCARMGQPDGGWYDETPPKVVGANPADHATNVQRKHIYINFDEFITIDNPTENVVVSPPQLEAPEIKGQGKRISVELMDSLKPNTTYTIDFSNAISDNNEGNPLGNYTYSSKWPVTCWKPTIWNRSKAFSSACTATWRTAHFRRHL